MFMDEAVLFHTKIRIHKLVFIFAYVILVENDVTLTGTLFHLGHVLKSTLWYHRNLVCVECEHIDLSSCISRRDNLSEPITIQINHCHRACDFITMKWYDIRLTWLHFDDMSDQCKCQISQINWWTCCGCHCIHHHLRNQMCNWPQEKREANSRTWMSYSQFSGSSDLGNMM